MSATSANAEQCDGDELRPATLRASSDAWGGAQPLILIRSADLKFVAPTAVDADSLAVPSLLFIGCESARRFHWEAHLDEPEASHPLADVVSTCAGVNDAQIATRPADVTEFVDRGRADHVARMLVALVVHRERR